MSLAALDAFPTVDFGAEPTPLEPLDRLTLANAGARLWAKRDDMQGLALGGNKVRQLAFYFGAAKTEGADTVLITGAVQSNYCRLAAAYAAKLGMECHIQQEERVPKSDPLYKESGNVLLERLLGATLHSFPAGEDEEGADNKLEEIAADLRAVGKSPYVIHLAPGHPPLGALGYVACARELLGQIDAMKVRVDHIAVPSGSGATHAGFLFGMRALGSPIPITGYCVRRDQGLQAPRLKVRCEQIADLLDIANPVSDRDIVVNDRFLLPGYGRLNLPTDRAIRLAAQTEALLLDPVYSGKCMAGALNIAGNLPPEANVLFLHTGGTPAIFAYANDLTEMLFPLPSPG
ncbi:MAG: D-cysteine desulfhydrase family protein [Pseudomonadota bacterium]